MPWIQNIGLKEIQQGWHYDAGINSMLIQIVDPGTPFPEPKYQFKERHQFFFLDLEDEDDFPSTVLISDEQAQEIARLLKHALDQRMNVVVHCHAGVCRSGAVVEVGVMLGFDDTEGFRAPNLRVKHKIMQALGLQHDSNKSPSVNGIAMESGLIVPRSNS